MHQIRLIVNGDDFGFSKEVNEAIIQAFREGVLTSCSLMVTGDAFEHAVELAKQNPGLGVGIHLVTVMGHSVLPKSEIPDLVDENQNFPSDPNKAGIRYYFSRKARQQLKKELAAQFQKFKETGLNLSHIDGHLHLHVHPVIFRIAMELGEKYDAKRMRVPSGELGLSVGFDRNRLISKTLYSLLFGCLASHMKRKLKAKEFAFPERVLGNLQSGRMSEDYFLYSLRHLQTHVNEIYFHPAIYPDSQMLDRERLQALTEFRALMSLKVSELVQSRNIKLINYFDLRANV